MSDRTKKPSWFVECVKDGRGLAIYVRHPGLDRERAFVWTEYYRRWHCVNRFVSLADISAASGIASEFLRGYVDAVMDVLLASVLYEGERRAKGARC